ncbi:MAG: UbiD family decarboxylase [Saprospiraceae bacterium]|nr:UbiD family decarboxylase [Saprospiraceae bacterium]MCB9325983.1 UbiD family decarboxylase [Lewinellaceae bacterium]
MLNQGHTSLRACVKDLEKHGKLIRITTELDPDLEMAEVHRRIFDVQGPAILFEKVKGSPFPAVSNLYGTNERTDFIFRHTLEKVKRLIELKVDPTRFLKKPFRYAGTPFTALNSLPRKRRRLGAPIMQGITTIDQLPQVKSWPDDGGAFITLPQVFTQPPGSTKIMDSNIGMYRIQLSGNEYIPNEEIGLHYQLHRGIGNHHTQYLNSDQPFRASIFVGGPPAHTFSAIMPLPEDLSEVIFAGLLGGKRFGYVERGGHVLSADADFVITGTIDKMMKKPEGPFGDHLGYYSLTHDFPVMKVDKVYHRKDAIWHFTVVGRPPAEDTGFGYLIHKLVEELGPQEFPGVKEIHAVDAAGVHPLLLAIGSERYMPFRGGEAVPEEILTQANRILGSGQTSLAKFLFIAATDTEVPNLTTHDIPAFLSHVLERVDWRRDLHFQTKTTIDTLDYSGSGWNAGSKVVIAAAGPKKRDLKAVLPDDFILREGFGKPRFVQPGILCVQGPEYTKQNVPHDIHKLSSQLNGYDLSHIPLIILVDDSSFVSNQLNNFLWATFTRANPAEDIHGISPFTRHKHWGCLGSLIIDSRTKPHHAPPLIPDNGVSEKVDRLFAKSGPLYEFSKKIF